MSWGDTNDEVVGHWCNLSCASQHGKVTLNTINGIVSIHPPTEDIPMLMDKDERWHGWTTSWKDGYKGIGWLIGSAWMNNMAFEPRVHVVPHHPQPFSENQSHLRWALSILCVHSKLQWNKASSIGWATLNHMYSVETSPKKDSEWLLLWLLSWPPSYKSCCLQSILIKTMILSMSFPSRLGHHVVKLNSSIEDEGALM